MFPPSVRSPRRSLVPVVVSSCVLGSLVLTGCAEEPGDAASGPEAVSVVTSTNVYADLVRQVGGDTVDVTAVIDSAAQDPHSYEASAQNRLAVEKADLVVVNGGGYDAFMDGLITDSQPVLDAVEVSGRDRSEDDAPEDDAQATGHSDEQTGHEGHSHEPGGFNEHVWYDLGTARKMTERVAEQLGELDPEHAGVYTDNAAALGKELDTLQEQLTSMHSTGGYLATEPMPGYLLQAAGLHDDTPAEFTAAMDAESDVAPGVLKRATDLITQHHVDLLAFNQQTTTGQTDLLRSAAQDAKVPVVEFSETLPDGMNYQEWMRENIEHVSTALGK